MKVYKLFTYCLFFLAISLELKGQPNTNESITLAQAYMNLSLTETYFDRLSTDRISKILPYEESELGTLTTKKFIRKNSSLYNFSYSLLYFTKAKLLFINKQEVTRDELIAWKNTLGPANRYYKRALTNPIFTKPDESLHDLINFNQDAKESLSLKIENLRAEFTPYFNNDIYPEFQKQFNNAKNSNSYNFPSLWTNAARYDLSLEFSILHDLGDKIVRYFKPSGDIIYELDLKHDLISRYIQLKYITSKQYKKTLNNEQIGLLYDSYHSFIKDLKKEKDEFILKELNSEVCETLFKEIQLKYPHTQVKFFKLEDGNKDSDSDGDGVADHSDLLYFFPNPAPLASANMTVENYKSTLTVLGDVDIHISAILNTMGYDNQLHYYYDLDGFALATSLEKFNADGTTIENDERWIKNLGSDGKFSYYEIFKSLFFEIESEVRMFAFIVASKNVSIGKMPLTPRGAEELIKNSYITLPENLKNKTLENKNLTVLVYHFHQNDIGEVPELELREDLDALEYLRTAGLDDLIKN